MAKQQWVRRGLGFTKQQDDLAKLAYLADGLEFVREEREPEGIGRRWWLLETWAENGRTPDGRFC